MSLLYKIMTRQEWEEAEATGIFLGSAVDRRDGFIHLSTARQVRETAEKHFVGQGDLVLVAVREGELDASLKWEASRGGALFPHVYCALSLSAVDHVTALPLSGGAHQFPSGILT